MDKGNVSMLDFEIKTEQFIEEHTLLQEGDKILAAVSGGPDSLAMVDFLYNRQKRYGIKIIVAHVDHMLRGEESLQDLYFVRDYCESKGISFHGVSINIKEKMILEQRGMQETARKYRYQYFEKIMEEYHLNKLIVAQHGDDQIETILMRLVRGSGGITRAGIQVRRPFSNNKEIVRPLLAVSKSEIEEYCSYYELNPRRDLSNEKKDYTRNRFRLEVLPYIKKENPRVIEHFQRFSEHITEDETYLLQLAVQEYNNVCKVMGEDKIIIDIPAFLKVANPLQRRVIHLILNYLYQQNLEEITSHHINLLIQLLKGDNPSGKLNFPKGLKVLRSYHTCQISFNDIKTAEPYRFELIVGEKAVLPNGYIIGIEPLNSKRDITAEDALILPAKEVQLPLIVRTRQPGDRLKGMNGTKKVKDIFIDMKIPLNERAVWPIITDYTGKLLWIPGLKKAFFETAVDHKQEYYQIQYSKQTFLGGNKVNET